MLKILSTQSELFELFFLLLNRKKKLNRFLESLIVQNAHENLDIYRRNLEIYYFYSLNYSGRNHQISVTIGCNVLTQKI
jgi:hypothetical protein